MKRWYEGEGGAESQLRAGDFAPDFTLPANGGQTVSLARYLRAGPVILSFLGGRHSGDAEAQFPALADCAAQSALRGGALLVLSPVARPIAAGLPLLHDAGCVVARGYGLCRGAATASVPATFLVGQDARIVLSLIDAAPGSPLACTNVLDALAALRRIAGAGS